MCAKLMGIGIATAVAAVIGSAANADTIYDWSWSGNGISATGTFDVLNDFIQSATGTITGGGLGTLTVSPVPLSATLPLLLSGFGGLGACAARRRKAAQLNGA